MKPFYSKEEMLGRCIVIVSNLKPATIRGVTSKGMLLAAEDASTCSLLDPKDASPGAEVFVDGIPREPAAIVEFDEFAQVNLIVGDNQEAWYAGKPLRSQNAVVVTDKKISKGAKIK
jgi:methionyl-tRNA synthetase